MEGLWPLYSDSSGTWCVCFVEQPILTPHRQGALQTADHLLILSHERTQPGAGSVPASSLSSIPVAADSAPSTDFPGWSQVLVPSWASQEGPEQAHTRTTPVPTPSVWSPWHKPMWRCHPGARWECPVAGLWSQSGGPYGMAILGSGPARRLCSSCGESGKGAAGSTC